MEIDLERIFPQLSKSELQDNHRVEVAAITSASATNVAVRVIDRSDYSIVDSSIEFDQNDAYVNCSCDAFSESKPTHCPHICELLRYMKWSEFPWPVGEIQLRRDDSRPTWKRVFRQLSNLEQPVETEQSIQQQVQYVIDLPYWNPSMVMPIQTFLRKRNKNGEWGAARRRTIDDLPMELLSEIDRTATNRMLECELHSGEDHHAMFGPTTQSVILQTISQTGQLYWSLESDSANDEDLHPLQWTHEVFRFEIDVSECEDGWRFQGQLQSGSTSDSIEVPVAITQSGIVLFEDRIGEFQCPDAAFPLVLAMRESGAFIVPTEDRDQFLDTLHASGAAELLNLPSELAYEVELGTPQPRAQIGKPERGSRALPVTVRFLYGGKPLNGQSGLVDHTNRKVLRRNSQAEQDHLDTLWESDVTASPSGFRLAAAHLPATVAYLSAAGWEVEADGKLIRNSTGINIAVQSGLDWFDLNGAFEFDGASVSIPKVLSAMRRGDNFVRLDDGSQGLLPEEWLAKYAAVAELAEADGDSLRFTMSQAAMLDAMLTAQDSVEVDRQFDQFRKKLRNFKGVKPAKANRAFRGELRAYQQDGLGWMKFLREFGLGGCLADDMGLGKTIQVLAMLQSERARIQRQAKKDGPKRHLPTLIVVPRSLMFNWVEEAEKFTPNLSVLQYHGLDRESLREQWYDHDIIVTTYGIVRRDIEFMVEQSFHYVVLDEAQAIKNNNSQAAKAVRLLNANHRLALTGTPIENHLGELWSMFEFLNPGLLGRSSTFMALARRAANDEEARKLLADGIRPFVLRRTKEDVLTDLPQKTENTLHCEMTPTQRDAYDELRDYYRTLLKTKVKEKGLNRSKIHVLEALLRLRQCACHPALLDEKSSIPSAKVDTLMEQLDGLVDRGHKALVFSQFTKLLGLVRRRLDDASIQYEYLDGRTRKREERVKAFQNDPDCSVFLISLKAGGHGLNLTAADYVFILDPWWNPAVEAQAVDRAHRIGQQKPVFAYRLICTDTVEDKIVELQEQKRELADSIINADASLMQRLTADDLSMLLS